MNAQNTAMTQTRKNDSISQRFVDANRMFEKMDEVTNKIAQRAFDLFSNREGTFGTPLDDWFKAEAEVLRPTPVEITESSDGVNIRAAVPGFKPDEIEISVKDDVLIFSGETKSEEKKEDENTFYSEWQSNRFCRQLRLPGEVETKNVEANLKDGVLQISLKKKAAEGAAKIAVKSA